MPNDFPKLREILLMELVYSGTALVQNCLKFLNQKLTFKINVFSQNETTTQNPSRDRQSIQTVLNLVFALFLFK